MSRSRAEPPPRSVAVVFHRVHPVWRKVFGGVLSYASERRTKWSICVHESPLESIDRLLTQSWDGMILALGALENREVLRLKVPLVGIELRNDDRDQATPFPYVTVDNTAIARSAAEHLIECGFHRLAFCGYRSNSVDYCWAEQRRRAFQEYVDRTGRSCVTHEVPLPTPATWGRIRRDLERWLIDLPKPIGLMACHDEWARQVLEVCRAIGIRVPEDVAVVGVDNEEAVCLATDPPLTSVDHGCSLAGYEAASLLDRRMAGQTIACGKHAVEPGGVIVRRSTNVVAIANPDVAAAVQFIRQHACEPIGLADVLAATAAADSTLRRQFKAILGRTIRAEIERVRLDRAKHLLTATDWNLRQIARESGFSSAAYLVALLRCREGLTPREYRRRYTPLICRTPGETGPNGSRNA